ncbi:MAG: DUF2189 domain-containing protein [Pseudomonadota bacterium]|nr:DUF2189 domain-containing protein [Pseudomonadota bacterium]
MPTDPVDPLSLPSGTPLVRDGRRVIAGQGATWWSDGWRLFTAAPWLWMGMTVVFVLIMLVLTIVPVIGHIASTLLYPAMGAGLLVGARAVDRGEPLTFSHLFSCFDKRLGSLVIVGLIYIGAWFVIWLIAAAICVALFGLSTFSAILSGGGSMATLDTLWTLGLAAIVALFIVLVLGTPLMMAYWFAPPLVALRGDGPVAALKASYHASARNVPALLVYGLMFIAFAIVASIPLGLGWLVLAPVVVGSMYASYRDIFTAEA